ncbi:MAG TPA: hypothetical protein VL572_07455 [Pyrinomonadaceae bacterium]|nr:hypothetical protein [Pyrinomonadaceae bacterium]
MSNEGAESKKPDENNETASKPTITIAEKESGQTDTKPTITIAEKEGPK